MLRDAWFVGSRDAAWLLRHREALLWIFAMPILFFYFVGTVTAGFGGGSGPGGGIPLVLEPGPAGGDPLLDALARRLGEQGFALVPGGTDPDRPPPVLELGDPEGLAAPLAAGRPVELTLRYARPGPTLPLERVRAARAVYGLLGDLAVLAARATPATPQALEALRTAPRRLSVEVVAGGRRRKIPNGFEQAIPGTLVMFTMLVMLTSGAILLVIEREEGLLRRLASTPIGRGSVVLGKWGARMAVGGVQVGFALLAGRILFGMDWGPSLGAVVLLLAAWAAFNASLGLLLGTLARSRAQMAGIGVMVTMLLASLGGCWWPIEVTPEWMQRLALGLPTGWAMDALHRLVIFRDPATSALPHTAALAAAAAAVGAAAARAFRYSG